MLLLQIGYVLTNTGFQVIHVRQSLAQCFS